MADIYARLKTTPNGPGPQHKKEGINEFEFTEGKDGKLNVRDVDVKAELELIKQQQQQILQRLNEPIETELTGSNVEEQTVTSQRSGILQGGGTTEVIFDTVGKVCELQSLSLGTNDAVYAQIRIMFYTEDGLINGYLRIARDDGSSLVNPTPFAVQEYSGGENDFWTVRKYDEQNSKYVLTMKRPLKSLNGFRIAIYNFKDEPIDVSINAVVSSQRKMVN